ncbi:virion structural protein [Erwinia phage PhiEaH1]|jgi:hypothetical protein|uniref:Virion structural protein n=1 Tax=Erwinia phage PhiEaH1 TaxID=1401669 RepID=W8CZQ7_9CAUD|nr:virion structural protein [Erwinia phage PhiEaH1]AGX01951.1 virion structural protein [Erwinia phage PhiEaH1]WBF04860.1 hypothetical protein [Erwinia phage vB_Ea277G]
MSLTFNPLTLLELANGLPNFVRAAKTDNLIGYTATTRVEPITLVETALWNQPYTPDIMQSALSMFASLYLSAVGLSATLNNVTVGSRLEQFNPKRDPVNGLADTVARMVSNEQMKFGLPTVRQVAVEGYRRKGNDAPETNTVGAKFSRENLAQLRENTNLAVGKILDVELTANGESVSTQVSVRLNTIPAVGSSIADILTAGAQNRDLKDRYYAVKADKLRFFQDLLGCADLLDQHRKAQLNDPTGLYMKAIRDQRRNALTGWLTGKPSVASASNIVIISDETQLEIERSLTIKLSKFKDRQRIFDNSGMLVLYVVDQAYEQVEIFYRGIEHSTKLSVSQMKNANKGGNGQELLKFAEMLQQRSAPTF